MPRIEIVNSITSSQHGVVAHYQLVEAGLTINQITNMLRSGYFARAAKGVYRIAGAQETWEQSAVIATLSCGKNGYLSHESVLMLFDLLPRHRNRASRRRTNFKRNMLIHVTTPRNRYRLRNVYFHRSTSIEKEETVHCTRGIRHMSIERALIDCAQQLTTYELDYVIDRALTQKFISLQRIHTLLDRLHTAPGREKLRTIALLTPYCSQNEHIGTESELEKRIESILSEISPFQLKKQHKVHINNRHYRIDLAIPEKMIAIEIDGFAHHRARMKFDDDRRRQNILIAAGWKLIRITAAFTDDEIRAVFSALLTNL